MGYSVHPMKEPAQMAEVARLWRANFRHPRIASAAELRLQWFYHENPAGCPATWLLRDDASGGWVGCASVMPRMMQVKGELRRVGILTDFAVDRAHRFAGAAVALQRAIAMDFFGLGYMFLFGYPSRAASGVLLRVGYERIAANVVWNLPIDTHEKLVGKVPQPMVRALSIVLDAGLAIDRNVKRILHEGDFETRVSREPCDGFDALWDRESTSFAIAGVRDLSYLHWRYSRHPTEKYDIFQMFETRSGSLVGYIVFSVSRSTGFVIDVFCNPRLSTVAALMIRFVAFAAGLGLSNVYVSLVGGTWICEALRRLHFLRTTSEGRSLMVYRAPDEARDAARWSMSEGELDV